MQKTQTITSESHQGYLLQATVMVLDNDDLVVVIGGGRDHIGALGLALPRSSLADDSRLSATSSVLTLPGHKEDEPAKYLSEKIAAATGRKVAAIVGIHYDELPLEDLQIIRDLWESLKDRIVSFINADKA